MRVGGDIGAICGKCGDVWHVVIAVVEGRIAKVECRECGARHRYRPAPGEAAVAARPRKSAPVAGTRRTRARAKQPIVAADPTRPRRSFCPSETYRVGDRLVHANFGEGVVQEVAGATKIRVLFDVGPKTLVHGRARS
jgi:hypothetical protein